VRSSSRSVAVGIRARRWRQHQLGRPWLRAQSLQHCFRDRRFIGRHGLQVSRRALPLSASAPIRVASVRMPSAHNALVGLRPTVGLVSRSGMVPLDSVRDTAGPMARSVTDMAILLNVIAGADAKDAATARQTRDTFLPITPKCSV